MTGATFPLDPVDLPALKGWLAAQDDPQGMLRPVEIAEILIGPSALLDLPAVLQRAGIEKGANVMLVMDETPMLRDDVDLKAFVRDLLYVAGYQESTYHLEDDEYEQAHADFEGVEGAVWGLEEGYLGTPATAIIALGSGTVTDIAKHAAYLYDQQHPDRPRMVYVCCPTANSVTAYAANMAVLLKDGVKRTIPSRYPDAVVCDLRVLSCAPRAMTLAGLGDCCARFVAYGDWYLASALGLVDYYSEVPLALLDNLDIILLEHALGIGQRTYAGEAVVMRALLLAGIAQSIINMSAPISGTEHVISHVLDMIADHNRRSLALHGAQVGVATLTAAGLYQRFLDNFDPAAVNIDTCYPYDEQLQRHIRHIFRAIDPTGAMARECWSDYSKKLALWRENRSRFERFCANWQQEYRPKLASLVRALEIVKRILEQAGAPLTIQALEPPISQREYDFAVDNGHFIRQRFVLGDLLYFLGWE
ncbi:MAG TPA: iron-containing alcohol dehydrogenase [Ktedonobacteraceae bacterium]|nr:iron-containing alcohol dehydrogenase [Ktedonobacteraceae bacterium]